MITKFRISADGAVPEYGMACQRLVPWPRQSEEPPLGVMASFLDPGAASLPDSHNQDEVMIILSGAGSVELAGEQVGVEAGDLIVLPKNNEHVVRNPGAQPLTWVSVYWPLHEPKPATS